MQRVRRTATFLALVMTCVLGLCQCSDDDTLAPFQPEVTSETDNFQLQATGVKDRSTALTYTWTNAGTRAKVNHSTTTTQGTARVLIEEAGGARVYDKILVPSLSDTTSTGASGNWTIRLQLEDYSGTLNFRVEKF